MSSGGASPAFVAAQPGSNAAHSIKVTPKGRKRPALMLSTFLDAHSIARPVVYDWIQYSVGTAGIGVRSEATP